MTQLKNIKSIITVMVILSMAIASCSKKKDPHVPPKMVLTTSTGYTYADKVVTHGDTILVGVTITKTEDDLKNYNVSYAYDGATTTTTFYNYALTAAEYGGYSHDIKIITRNIAGTEKWIFAIVDRDGNITQKTITLTVQ